MNNHRTHNDFSHIYLVDMGFDKLPAELPRVNSVLITNMKTGQLVFKKQPFELNGDNQLVVTRDSGKAMLGYLALGWSLPKYTIDLDIENNHASFSYSELKADMNSTLLDSIDMEYALVRGDYLKASAVMESNGIPVDVELLNKLKANESAILNYVIAHYDADYGIHDSQKLNENRFQQYLTKHHIKWPKNHKGKLILTNDTFKKQAAIYPQITPLRKLRKFLSEFKTLNFPVANDNRNRCSINPFASKTGRNQPSNREHIFGPAVWVRNLIRTKEGMGIAYIDWSQQEFGIAAALSGDQAMQEAYTSGDPYLAFAIQAGSAPKNATKKTHSKVREVFKHCTLAVQYGMSARSLAEKIKQPVSFAEELLNLHHQTYKTFWKWSDGNLDYAMLNGHLTSVLGWRLKIGIDFNPRSIRNFPMQANGAEMLRLACCMLVDEGIKVCTPVHDAVLIEAPIDQLNQTVIRAQEIMATASSVILSGFELRSDADIYRHPNRYQDKRGAQTWKLINQALDTA